MLLVVSLVTAFASFGWITVVEIPVMMERLSEDDIAAGKTTGPTTVKLECVMQYYLEHGNIVKLHRDKTRSREKETTLLGHISIAIGR